jgi:hypothetical protein
MYFEHPSGFRYIVTTSSELTVSSKYERMLELSLMTRDVCPKQEEWRT